ncbi:bifunctional DNA-formamidopyrimidine glycosylase/DNA-(apurinic or apyrimidinic site) lyase [Nitratireductor mangrovi]|uniref:Formamidopyrimidine-DNA glycosylase n=1 Tax=Nitratireductor mangrovi TaxID=2599600 RepID=A0A5B8L079_9HYPH|nr:bifunctional DNA-formamidopyrimidine glycosylase/DNA-(apurinic or apyrimidinic site) lyase [Nitratireductor mangrovi]QDZ01253.1 bifunctional DNA-formamidopyrimidine glycosylase/DNA-(apurinic or apyrimidinic site) lyase [Nitratireductor mangrovi]
MPELPEVETVRRGLAKVMEGARIVSVEQRRPDLRFPFPPRFGERLQGRTIGGLARRAKYLLAHLDDGLTLISHLGMSGSWRIERDGGSELPGRFHHERSTARPHDHVVLRLEPTAGGPARVIFNDPRRFGFMLFAEPGKLGEHPLMAGLGVEPTGNTLDGALLARLFRDRRAPLKAALLDQRLIAGLGNIYVCEALWRAKLSPLRAAGSIVPKSGRAGAASERLATAVREVIADAIAAGGSSLRDYRQADGELGYFQHSFSVYDREGEACRHPGCRGTVMRTVQSGRSTFHCVSCQR